MQAALDSLYNGGIVAKAAAAGGGKPMSDKARADVRQYNALLNSYVKAKCHK